MHFVSSVIVLLMLCIVIVTLRATSAASTATDALAHELGELVTVDVEACDRSPSAGSLQLQQLAEQVGEPAKVSAHKVRCINFEHVCIILHF